MLSRSLFTLSLYGLFVPVAQAASETPPGVSSTSFIQAFVGLAVIVALLIGTAWFARKMTGGRGFGQGGMRIIGGVAIGPRERIVLLEVGEHWLVIGIVPGQIRKLHTLPKGEMENLPMFNFPEKPFAQWLKKISERQDKNA